MGAHYLTVRTVVKPSDDIVYGNHLSSVYSTEDPNYFYPNFNSIRDSSKKIILTNNKIKKLAKEIVEIAIEMGVGVNINFNFLKSDINGNNNYFGIVYK